MKNCQANGNGNSETEEFASSIGFSFLMTNFVFENCQANENNCPDGEGPQGFNGGPSNTTTAALNGVFLNCTANSNTSATSRSTGFNLAGNSASLINCQSNSNIAASDCNGFLVFPGSVGVANDFEFIDCTANNNNCGGIPTGGAPVTGAKGFVIVFAYEVIMRDCVAIGNTISGDTTVGSPAYGIALQGVQNAKLDNCVASENYAVVANGNSAGFHLDGFAITLNNCLAEQNDGTLGSNNYEIINQFYTNPYNVNILNSVAIGDPGQANSVGILLQNALNCIIEGNKIESNVQDGILLTGTCPDNAQNVIKHNQIIAPNPFSFPGYSLTGIWAIEDNTAIPDGSAPTNTYYDNYAWNYPGNVLGMTNYNTGVRDAGADSPTYIEPWIIPGPVPLPSVLSKLTNLDISYTGCENSPT